MRYDKCVIFDLDGTLTRSEQGIWNSVRYVAEQLHLPVPDAPTLRKFIGPPLDYSFQTWMGMTPEQADEATRIYRARYQEVGLFENRVYPGIRRLLRGLKAQGCWVGVATGKPQGPSERIIEHFGLAPFVDRIVGPTVKMGAEKDALIRKALPGEYGEAWMVGDRKFDVEGGRAVGIRTLGVGYGYGSEEELRAAGCDAYAATVQDVIDLFCPEYKADGAFLSMEGLDGSGKTTQMGLLTEALDCWGFEVVTSREPGGCKVAEAIRGVVLSRENVGMTDVTEALLYAAARAQHVREVIRPAIAAGKVLLCDRFVDSSVAYQGGGRELGVQWVLDINTPAVDGTLPLATVYLDIGHRESLRRRAAATELDRLEMEGDSFHARTEAAYRELIARDPQRFIVVDATRSPETIGQEIADRVLARLMEAGL
ncbi:MAG: dTMP kinase [Christensenellaceae bacterium]|nr:dTMP kinase [Christensenellaceae bacterium]